MPKTISESRYLEERESDAENYRCPSCEEMTVFGVEQALIMEMIEIGEDDEDE